MAFRPIHKSSQSQAIYSTSQGLVPARCASRFRTAVRVSTQSYLSVKASSVTASSKVSSMFCAWTRRLNLMICCMRSANNLRSFVVASMLISSSSTKPSCGISNLGETIPSPDCATEGVASEAAMSSCSGSLGFGRLKRFLKKTLLCQLLVPLCDSRQSLTCRPSGPVGLSHIRHLHSTEARLVSATGQGLVPMDS